MDSAKLDVSLFDLGHTFESGQPLTFFGDYSESGNTLLYPYGSDLISVGYRGNSRVGKITISAKDTNAAALEVYRRFRLSDDMKKIYKRIGTDEHVASSIVRYEGLRLTLNDPWETTMCFIISQFNNVKRIRLIVKNIIARYGREIVDEEGKVIARTFPKSDELTNATVKDFSACGTGFRAKFLVHAVDYCTNNLDLYRLGFRKYEKIKEELMEIQGVGDKVADCIALMGYGDLNAFPIDVHIKRSMEKLYFKGKKKKIKEIHELSKEMWGEYRGYANQYLFHRARNG